MANQPRATWHGSPPPGSREDPVGAALVARRDRLYARLEDGWAEIDRVEAAGRDAGALTDFWIALLREYERVCDRIAAEEPWPPRRTA